MRQNGVLVIIIFLSLVGCSPKERIADPSSSGPSLNDYLPLKAGNAWTYSSFTVNTGGLGDTSVSSPVVLSVFETNVVVGGQPNAFIVRSDNEQGHVSYLAFNISGNTLWSYLGTGATFGVEDNFILWTPGGSGGALVGVNQTQKYYVSDQSGTSTSFFILRSPDSSIALAMMASPDTVKIKGVSAGETAFTLQRTGGTAADTMTVLIGVSSNLPSSLTSPLPPWIPLWQLTTSSSDQTIFSLDTTYPSSASLITQNAETSCVTCSRTVLSAAKFFPH